MAATYKHVRPGHRGGTPAADYNAAQDAARKVLSEDLGKRQTRRPQARPGIVVECQNATDYPLPAGSILAIDGPRVTPDQNPDVFARELAVRGVEPTANTPPGRFVVLLEGAGVGGVVPAVVSGIARCKVDMLDPAHAFADVVADETAHLQSGETGGGELLWSSGTTGVVDALVRVGGVAQAGSSLQFVRALEEHIANGAGAYPAKVLAQPCDAAGLDLPGDPVEVVLVGGWGSNTGPFGTSGGDPTVRRVNDFLYRQVLVGDVLPYSPAALPDGSAGVALNTPALPPLPNGVTTLQTTEAGVPYWGPARMT